MSNLEIKDFSENKEKKDLNLTPEQQKSFENFLKEKWYKEPLFLSDDETQKHLAEFKKELEKNPENKNSINSSSELLTWSNFEKSFWNKENFDKFSKTLDFWVYGYFFGGNGILKDINISESEKKSFVASSSVYLMDNFYEEVVKTWNLWAVTEEIKKILWNSEEKWDLSKLGENLTSGTWFSESISIIKDIFSGNVTKIFAKVYKEEKLKLISESFSWTNLKNNQIFNNPNETFTFFDNALKNNFSSENLKKFIESKNSDNPVNSPKDLQKFKEIWDKLGNFITPEVWNTLWNISNIFDIFTNGKDKIKNTLLENENLMNTLQVIWSMPIIWGLLKMFFGFLGINLEAPYDTPEKNLEKISRIIISKWSLLEWKKLTENFWKDKNDIDENFIKNLKIISKTENHKDFSKNLENLFKKSGEFENFINDSELKKLEWFEEKSNLINEKWEIIYENLKYLTEIYKEYLQQKENNENLNISDFINQKSSGNKDIENEIYGNNQPPIVLNENSNNQTSEENILTQSNDLTKKAEEALNQNRKKRQNSTTENIALTSAVWASLVASTKETLETKPDNNDKKITWEPIFLNQETNKNISNIQTKEQNQKNTETEKETLKNNSKNQQNSTPKENKPLQKTEPQKPVEQKATEKKPEQNNFIINKNENIEFSKDKVSFILDVSGKKYEASLYWNQKWHLTIIWNGEKVIFNWGKEFYETLSKFNWKLDKEAEASDFWKNVWMINPKLWTSIKNILINGYDKTPWLKQILSQNFFNSWNLVKNNVSINFSDKNYNLNFEKAEWQKLA